LPLIFHLRWLRAAALAGAIAPLSLPAQPPSLEEIVARLQANLDAYETSIPSFLCDEHLDSEVHQFGARGASAQNFQTIADSVFRLRRQPEPGRQAYVLNESRDPKVIDGKPAEGHELDPPLMIQGAFSGGFAFVSTDEQKCMSYKIERLKPNQPFIIHFETLPDSTSSPDCILREAGSGRVFIDPASMEIERVEITVPHHVVHPAQDNGVPAPAIVTRWTVQVDYAPVVLDNRTFWLPKKIASTSANSLVEWTFNASYRNYHKLEVRSRIVVPDDSGKK